MKLVLEVLLENKLFAKMSKCVFGCHEVKYLGHLISGHEVKTDPRKIEAMQNWPTPTSIKALRGFLGLTGYYGKFIKNYGVIAAPLTALRKILSIGPLMLNWPLTHLNMLFLIH